MEANWKYLKDVTLIHYFECLDNKFASDGANTVI